MGVCGIAGDPDYDGGAPVLEFHIDMTAPDNERRQVYCGRDHECTVARLGLGRSTQHVCLSCFKLQSHQPHCCLCSLAGTPLKMIATAEVSSPCPIQPHPQHDPPFACPLYLFCAHHW